VPWRRRLTAIGHEIALLVVVVAVRVRVLHGWGGAGDARAGVAAKLFQIASGLAHIFTGDGIMPEVLAFGAGTAIIALATYAALRRRNDVDSAGLLPLAFCALSTAPLLAAGWAVGARYFYLPAVGLAWAAAEALAAAGVAAHLALASVLAIVGGLQAVQRRADVVSYDRRVAAARRVVVAGLGSGYRVFNIMSGVKDLDLAVKEDRGLGERAADVLVLTDVPASFVIVPPALTAAAAPLIAQPPLPPSGAYQFGDVRVVGLARREDGPSLREVWQRFPDIRFVRLRPVPSGQIVARDVTDETRQRLSAEGVDDTGLDGNGNDGQD
jgi:hypothetical protein